MRGYFQTLSTTTTTTTTKAISFNFIVLLFLIDYYNRFSMKISPGPYMPFPVLGERSETPPPDFDPSHPFMGIELIVSGLPFTSISSASEHLSQIVQDLVNNDTPMPELQIVSPSTRQPLDFVYVSLS